VNLELMAVLLGGCSLAVGLTVLFFGWRILRSTRRAERAGDERLEILREQQERLSLMYQEHETLHQELERLWAALNAQEQELNQHSGGRLNLAIANRIARLQAQLEAERQAHAEARRLLMAYLDERTPPQLEPPREESSESPESSAPTGAPTQPGGDPQRATERSQEQSWWRRMFGG
jgi:septal ring factor EnvC (AmiA/AmiB activator)